MKIYCLQILEILPLLSKRSLTILLLLLCTLGRAEHDQVSRLLETVHFIPVHLNGSPEEYTLLNNSVRGGRYALIGGKYVGVPILAFSIASQLAGNNVDWEAITKLTMGYTAIMGAQAFAFNVISEPLLVLMSPEELRFNLNENPRYFPPYYSLYGLKSNERKLLNHIIKGRSIHFPNYYDQAVIERLDLSGNYVMNNKKWVFAVTELQGLRASDAETISLADASCGGFFRRIFSAIR